MHTLQLLYSSIPKDEHEPLPSGTMQGVCAFTGAIGPCVPRAVLLGKSFTDQHVLRAPDSPLVSVEAWVALKYKWERMSSWLCDGTRFKRLDRRGVRDYVIGGVSERLISRWAGYITTSYKKHGSLRAPVNSRDRQVWLFESRLVDCSDRVRLAEWWSVMTQAQLNGVSRQSQETLDMPPGIIRKVGVDVWEQYKAWARDKWQSPLYALLCYLLPSQAELRGEVESPVELETETAPPHEPPPEPAMPSPPSEAPLDGQLSLF
jgi:hypothetical protein